MGPPRSVRPSDPVVPVPACPFRRGSRGRGRLRSGGGSHVVLHPFPYSIELAIEELRSSPDREGRFEFQLTALPGDQLRISLPLGWRSAIGPVTLSDSEARGSEPVSLFIERTEPVPFRARVTDAATGEPVPDLDVRIVHLPGEIECTGGTTDSRGWLSCPDGLSLGEYDLVPREPRNGWSYDSVAFTHRGGALPLDIPVDLGPTYFLEWEPPPGSDPEMYLATVTHARSRWDRWGDPDHPVYVRGGLRPWVRVPSELIDSSSASSWTLTLLSEDRHWLAEGKVFGVVGIQDPSIPIQNRQTSGVHGRVCDAAGAPIAGGSVTLECEDRDGPFVDLGGGSLRPRPHRPRNLDPRREGRRPS